MYNGVRVCVLLFPSVRPVYVHVSLFRHPAYSRVPCPEPTNTPSATPDTMFFVHGCHAMTSTAAAVFSPARQYLAIELR